MPSARITLAVGFFLTWSLCAAASTHEAALSSLPIAAQSRISAALGSNISGYRVQVRDRALRAENSRQKLVTTFTSQGVEVRSGLAGWRIALRGYGYTGTLITAKAVAPQAASNRVEYRRGTLTEWYVNGPAGLEQGFTIRQAPGQANGQPLTIALAFSGDLKAAVDPIGAGLTLSDPAGKVKLRYSGLAAYDANGKELRASEELRGDQLLLKVEDSGARYPVTIDPWVQLAELTPTSRVKNDWFGIGVAISGNTVAVGAFDSGIEQTGQAYVFVKPASGWTNMTQTAMLTPSDGGQSFGNAVAISGNIIVVGAANASNLKTPAQGPGAVYVFVRPKSGWTNMTETAKLTASDGMAGDALGYTVGISGSTVVAGAFFAHGGAGAAYVFVRPKTGWTKMTETAELTTTDSSSFDFMGAAAISGSTVVTGAYGHNNFQGAAYVFVEPATGWANMTQTAELTASDGKPSDLFGFSVAISGDTVVAGAVGRRQGIGAAYVYVKPTSGWVTTSTYNARLTAPRSAQAAGFAQSVAIAGKRVVAGATGTTVGGNQNQGAAFVYSQPVTGWKTTSRAQAELTASDGGANDGLGVAVGVSGSTVVAGATRSDQPGVAYVFGKN